MLCVCTCAAIYAATYIIANFITAIKTVHVANVDSLMMSL